MFATWSERVVLAAAVAAAGAVGYALHTPPPCPACPKVEAVTHEQVQVQAPKCEATAPQVRVVYRSVPGPSPACPPTLVPDVSVTGGSSSAGAAQVSAGGGSASSAEPAPTTRVGPAAVGG